MSDYLSREAWDTLPQYLFDSLSCSMLGRTEVIITANSAYQMLR